MVFGTPPKIQLEPALPEEGSQLDSLVEQVPAEDLVELLGKKEVVAMLDQLDEAERREKLDSLIRGGQNTKKFLTFLETTRGFTAAYDLFAQAETSEKAFAEVSKAHETFTKLEGLPKRVGPVLKSMLAERGLGRAVEKLPLKDLENSLATFTQEGLQDKQKYQQLVRFMDSLDAFEVHQARISELETALKPFRDEGGLPTILENADSTRQKQNELESRPKWPNAIIILDRGVGDQKKDWLHADIRTIGGVRKKQVQAVSEEYKRQLELADNFTKAEEQQVAARKELEKLRKKLGVDFSFMQDAFTEITKQVAEYYSAEAITKRSGASLASLRAEYVTAQQSDSRVADVAKGDVSANLNRATEAVLQDQIMMAGDKARKSFDLGVAEVALSKLVDEAAAVRGEVSRVFVRLQKQFNAVLTRLRAENSAEARQKILFLRRAEVAMKERIAYHQNELAQQKLAANPAS